MLTKEQLKDRNSYLGGSDIPAVLGLNPYMTALELWAIKTGQIEPKDISDKLQVRLGNKLEPVVSELFEEETGKKLHKVNEEFVHPKYSFLRAHIDRRVVGEKSIAEIKTTSPWRLKDFQGEDEMPAAYIIQTVYYMALTGATKGYVAVLFGNQDFKIITIEKDLKLEADIIKKSVHFWNEFVLKKQMPAVTKNDADTLYSLFPSADEGMEIGLGDEASVLCEEIDACGQDMNLVMDKRELARNKLRAMMLDASIARTDRYTITWKNQTKKAYQVPESKSRVLRISEIKEIENGNDRIGRKGNPKDGNAGLAVID
jgi:putative phage-type endonuclease